MHEIKCPKCGEIFQVDETGYAQIVKQIHDSEFNEEIERRLHELVEQKDGEFRLSMTQKQAEYVQQISEKDCRISELQAKLDSGKVAEELAVKKAVSAKDIELSEKISQIELLGEKLKQKDSEKALSESSLKERYEAKLKDKDEQISYYKDLKSRQNNKIIGENLEQHCMTQFNSIRMMSFPNAYFEKDNDARTGSKGDFIFRESSDGSEFISIMFEMKNEMDETATKHKNEDFFKELDKDRREKGCEYAVLVTMLEADNEYYNNGIVDVSYRYPKMYVVRPQFFIPIISLLRNAALNSLQYQRELQIVKNQQLDLQNFENEMAAFKDAFSKNYSTASKKFRLAIEEIDKTIDHLQKTKDALLSSENQLRLANSKAEDLSIKKLTRNAPSVRAMFEEIPADEQ